RSARRRPGAEPPGRSPRTPRAGSPPRRPPRAPCGRGRRARRTARTAPAPRRRRARCRARRPAPARGPAATARARARARAGAAGRRRARPSASRPAARGFDDRLGLRAAAPALGLGPLRRLEVLVALEEVLDLVAQLGLHVGDVGDAVERRVAERHAEHLLVGPLLVAHVEDADRPDADAAAREGRVVDEDEGVERVAVFGERLLDVAVGAGGHASTRAGASPCSRSAITSSADSMPTESRTGFGGAANGAVAV